MNLNKEAKTIGELFNITDEQDRKINELLIKYADADTPYESMMIIINADLTEEEKAFTFMTLGHLLLIEPK